MKYLESKFKESLKNIDLYDIDQYNNGFVLLHELYLQLMLSKNIERYVKVMFYYNGDIKPYIAILDLEKFELYEKEKSSQIYAWIDSIISIKLI